MWNTSKLAIGPNRLSSTVSLLNLSRQLVKCTSRRILAWEASLTSAASHRSYLQGSSQLRLVHRGNRKKTPFPGTCPRALTSYVSHMIVWFHKENRAILCYHIRVNVSLAVHKPTSKQFKAPLKKIPNFPDASFNANVCLFVSSILNQGQCLHCL